MHNSWITFKNLFYSDNQTNTQKWYDEIREAVIYRLKAGCKNGRYNIDPIEISEKDILDVSEELKRLEFKRFNQDPVGTFAKCTKNMLSFYKWDSTNLRRSTTKTLRKNPFQKRAIEIYTKNIDKYREEHKEDKIEDEVYDLTQVHLDLLKDIQYHVRLYILGEKSNELEPYEKEILNACLLEGASIEEEYDLLSEKYKLLRNLEQWKEKLLKKRYSLTNKLMKKVIPDLQTLYNIPANSVSRQDILSFLGQKIFRK